MAKTVALKGQMNGPTVTGSGAPADLTFTFVLTHPSDSKRRIQVTWRDIWWIDAYPHERGDTAAGQQPAPLGERTIHLDSNFDIGNYLNGPITESADIEAAENLAARTGPEMMYAVGPQGTTFPPCLCHW